MNMQLIGLAVLGIFAWLALEYFSKMMSGTEATEEAVEEEKLPYARRPYIFFFFFETTELDTLIKEYGERFHVFPQIRIETFIKSLEWSGRTKINKKSVDFLLCDRRTASPVLAVELDGASHAGAARRNRDLWVDKMFQSAGMAIVHINASDLKYPARIREMIDHALAQVLTVKHK